MTGPTQGRVRLTALADPESALRPGAVGTVEHVDDFGTVHVRWDDGAQLGLIPVLDTWEAVAHRITVFARGTAQDELGRSQPGYAARCECGAITFGGFRSPSTARAACKMECAR